MDNMEKISVAGGIFVLLLSLYSFFAGPLYSPSIGLNKTGFLIGVLVSVVSMLAIKYAGKSKSAGEAVVLVNTGAAFMIAGITPTQLTNVIIFAAFFATAASSLHALGITKNRMIFIFAALIVMSFYISSFYLSPSTDVARGQGTVLSDNWFNALNWIKNNTPECAVVATYWDPGHFIRSIAERPVVFDGATQGAIRTVPAPDHEDGLVVVPYDNGIKHIINYKDGNATTSRINDIAISLMTSNESLALELLEKYRIPGCNSMYYIASSDLIGKSVWWTYFSTWDPTVTKGTPYSYQIMNLRSARPLPGQNAIAYTYPVSQSQAFMLIVSNSTVKAYFQQANQQPIPVQGLIFNLPGGNAVFSRDPNAEFPGTLLVQGDRQVAIYMPEQIQDSMFTRMFLFNGAGLKNFQLVDDWGGEVKLFKVNFGK